MYLGARDFGILVMVYKRLKDPACSDADAREGAVLMMEPIILDLAEKYGYVRKKDDKPTTMQ